MPGREVAAASRAPLAAKKNADESASKRTSSAQGMSTVCECQSAGVGERSISLQSVQCARLRGRQGKAFCHFFFQVVAMTSPMALTFRNERNGSVSSVYASTRQKQQQQQQMQSTLQAHRSLSLRRGVSPSSSTSDNNSDVSDTYAEADTFRQQRSLDVPTTVINLSSNNTNTTNKLRQATYATPFPLFSSSNTQKINTTTGPLVPMPNNLHVTQV